MLPSQRALFDIPDGVTYLNCASMSPQLRVVTGAGERAVRIKAAPWSLTPRDWFSGAERLRTLFARLVNGESDGVAIVPSVSYGIAVAVANVTVGEGQSIVLLEHEFPSNVYAWRELARKRRAEVRMASRRPGESWTDALLRTIDHSTAVVSVPNCHWTDGARIDLLAVGERARSSGAAFVVDASQSVGAYPLDVAAVQPDFLVTVGYKWLLGPYGLGFLYVAPRWRAGTPIEQSWITRAGSENFSRLIDYTDEYRAGARRFDMGEFSQFVLAPMMEAALLQLLQWGVPAIQETLSALTARVVDGSAAFGGQALPAAERVGHMVGIRLSRGVDDRLGTALGKGGVHVSIRGDSIRVAPHVYNDAADVERFLGLLRGAAS